MSFLTDYIIDKEFQMHYIKGKLNIVNYVKINYMEKEKVSLVTPTGRILIKGDNLRIQKLLDNEILMSGKIETIELIRETHG